MGARYDNIAGVQHKVSKQYDNINGVWRPVSKRYNNIGGAWRQSYVLGATPAGAFSTSTIGGEAYRYHFNPQVTYQNGLHLNVPWTKDGGGSGSADDAALLYISIPIAFNQTVYYTSAQPIWGINTAFSGLLTYGDGSPSSMTLYLNSTNAALINEAFRIEANSLTFNPIETHADQTMSLSSTYFIIELYFDTVHTASYDCGFSMDIPNGAIYVLVNGSKLPFIF